MKLYMRMTRKLKNSVVNRTSAAFFLALVFLGGACISSSSATEFLEQRQDWLVLKRHDPFEIITVLNSLPSEDVRTNYPQLLTIAWGYKSLSNGLPTESESARGKILYTAFDQILGQDGIYAMSRTGNGGRTIYYYVKDFPMHSSSLKAYLDSLPPISINVSVRNEPRWNSVVDVLENAKPSK